MPSIEHAFGLADPEEFEVDAAQRKARERWLATYSAKALQQGALIDKFLVRHDRFQQLLGTLDRMFLLSKELRQPIGGVIGGSAGVGKSTLCRYFVDTLPQHDLAESGSGLVYIRLRRGRSLAAVVQQIFGQLRYPPFRIDAASLDAKRSLSLDALRRRKIRLLLVDEGHQIMPQRVSRREDGSAISEYFRELMDEAGTAVCLVGGTSLADLGRIDPFLESRCVVNEALRDFALDDSWLSLVQSLMPANATLNFKKLQASREVREGLHKSTHGNLRRLKQFLTELAMATVDARKSEPDQALLQLAFHRAFGTEELPSSPWK